MSVYVPQVPDVSQDQSRPDRLTPPRKSAESESLEEEEDALEVIGATAELEAFVEATSVTAEAELVALVEATALLVAAPFVDVGVVEGVALLDVELEATALLL